MDSFSFAGSYQDDIGDERIVRRVEPSERRGLWPGFELRVVIRGVEFWGYDFDALEPVDREAATAGGFLMAEHGDLDECVLEGDLPRSRAAVSRSAAGSPASI